jgi:arginase
MPDRYILTPYFLDQPLPGLSSLQQPGWKVVHENLPPKPTTTRLGTLYEGLAREVAETIQGGDRPVSVAGDCCTTLGVHAGLKRSGLEPQLIWFDAHGDFNTWETTPSGFLGGMPLAMLAGLGEQTILEILKVDPLPQERILLAGARDLDPGEWELVTSSGITHLPDSLELLESDLPDRPLWVHFDTDVVDPRSVPAQNYPAPDGPAPEELARVFERLARTRNVCAVSLSSWAPDLPGAEKSQKVSLELLDLLLS